MELPKRNPNRIRGFDYSQNGAYFVTICTQNRQRILSKIVGTPVPGCPQAPCPELLSYGKIADKYIRQMDTFYDHLSVDNYVIMPAHIHIIIWLDNGSMWASTPTGAKKQHNRVSNILRSIKVLAAKEIGALRPRIEILSAYADRADDVTGPIAETQKETTFVHRAKVVSFG